MYLWIFILPTHNACMRHPSLQVWHQSIILMRSNSYTGWPEHPRLGMSDGRIAVLGLCAHLHARGCWPLPREGEPLDSLYFRWKCSWFLTSLSSLCLCFHWQWVTGDYGRKDSSLCFHSICSKISHQAQSSDPYGYSRLQESSRLFPLRVIFLRLHI